MVNKAEQQDRRKAGLKKDIENEVKLCYSVKEADSRFRFEQSRLAIQRSNGKNVLLNYSFNEVRSTEPEEKLATHISSGREINLVD